MLAFQFSSLAIYAVLFLFWIIPRKSRLRDKNVFVALMLFVFFSCILDAFANYIVTFENLPLLFREMVFKTYLSALTCTAYFELAYLISRSLERKYVETIAKYSIIAPLIDVALIYFLDMNIAIKETGVDIIGGSITCAYACAGAYLLLIIISLILGRKNINRWNRICFIIAAIVWSFAVLIQYFTTKTGIVTVAFVCSTIAIFAFIENPLNYIDYKYSCFKNNCIIPYLDKLIRIDADEFAILVKVSNTNKTNDSNDDIVKLRKEIISFFKKKKMIDLFITVNEEVLILCGETNKYSEYVNKIGDMIEAFYDKYSDKTYFEAITLSCQDVCLFDTGNDLIDCFSKNQNQLSSNTSYNTLFEITNNEVKAIKDEENIKAEIINALNEDRLEAFVQPIYSVEKKKIVSAESLARIRKADGSMMLPYQFIPVAEESGLDVQLGYRMIEKICQYMHDPITGSLFEYVDINLSIAQCEEDNLSSRIIGVVQKYDIDPVRLNFEITESGYINKMGNIEKNIRILTGFGFGFSLDDFGNGESNIDYLIEMPVKYLKLDMHMIWAYFENNRAEKTVQSIIRIAHDMNLKVVAEGVENETQFNELAKQGVDFVQGYYFYKPMRVEEYVEIAKNKDNQ